MQEEEKSATTSKANRSANLGRTLLFLRRTIDALRGYFAELLRVKELDRARIYFQVFQNAEFADLNYWLEVVFSIGIATLGLIVSSPAVVIGAMLISPLMGPIFGVGLAIALGDFYLGLKSVINVALSSVGSILLAAVITWVLPFHSPTSEILARVQPTLLDLAIAVLSGLAGAIVICRGGAGGGVTALPGVAVAVALMPPLGVVGFGVGIGWDWNIISGGGLLFLTNLVAIVLSAVLVFFSIRMDAPVVRKEITDWIGQQELSDAFYDLVQHTPLRKMLGNVGTLPRRMLILLIFLGVVCFPLVRTLNRIVDDARVRRAALQDVENTISKDSLFREDVDVEKELIHVRVVAVLPQGFSDAQRRQLETDIQQHTGRKTEVLVYPVATRAELVELTGRSPGSPAAHLETIDELQNKLWLQLKPAIAAVWPSEHAPLLGATVSFSENSAAIEAHLVYLADADLGELGQDAVRKSLRERSGSKSLEVSFERVQHSWKFSFLAGAAALSSSSRKELQDLVLILNKFQFAKCSLSVAGEKSGKNVLSEKRRTELLRALTDGHIPAGRIEAGAEVAAANTASVKVVVQSR